MHTNQTGFVSSNILNCTKMNNDALVYQLYYKNVS